MKRFLLLITALMSFAVASWAHDVEIDGIYYNLDEFNKTAQVVAIGECSDSISIPASILYESKIYNVTSIGNGAFNSCLNLKLISIGENIRSMGQWVFYDCDSLTTIVWNPITYPDTNIADESPFYRISKKIETFIFGDKVEYIPQHLCYQMTVIKDIIIPNSVTTIAREAFRDCSNLRNVDIGQNVTTIGYHAFSGSALENDYSSYDEGLLYIDNCLISARYCFKNGQLSIKEGTRIISESAFEDCPNGITSVVIPSTVISIGHGAFYDANTIQTVIWNAKNHIDSGVVSDIFYEDNITSIIFGEDVELIPDYLCNRMYNLKSIVWNAKNCSSEAVFNRVKSQIISFSFGEKVENIPNGLCEGMSKLSYIEIPSSVKSIGDNAFYGCEKVEKVIVHPTSVPKVSANSFDCYDATLYVLCDIYDDYFNNDVFGKFKVVECINEEVPTAILETFADANITISEGVISCPDSDFTIYNTIGQNVTAQNGALTPGVYVVQLDNDFVKVMMK